ncbi:hypothetical protein FRC08_011851 [Ceratobasidium sp. 394]|nr:hypothetical protein FRC08_011851 [Ceratobasidium sp. 394]
MLEWLVSPGIWKKCYTKISTYVLLSSWSNSSGVQKLPGILREPRRSQLNGAHYGKLAGMVCALDLNLPSILVAYCKWPLHSTNSTLNVLPVDMNSQTWDSSYSSCPKYVNEPRIRHFSLSLLGFNCPGFGPSCSYVGSAQSNTCRTVKNPLPQQTDQEPIFNQPASPPRASLSTLQCSWALGVFETNAREVAVLLQDVSLQDITVKHLNVVAIDWQMGSTPASSLVDLPSWVVGIASKTGHQHLESLRIIFEPPARKSMDVQLQTLKQIACQMPNLAHAVLGSPDVEWRRRSKEQSELPSRVPDWTPRPNHRDPEILSWWLDMLEPCDAAKARKGNLEGACQLRDSMLAHWDKMLLPPIEALRTRLSDVDSGVRG